MCLLIFLAISYLFLTSSSVKGFCNTHQQEKLAFKQLLLLQLVDSVDCALIYCTVCTPVNIYQGQAGLTCVQSLNV